MNHALLASLAAVTLGTNALLSPGIAHASPAPEAEFDVTAVMGPEEEYQLGLTVNGVAPTLRSVTVNGETILAYCIEYWVRAASPDHQAAVTGWDGFTGDNNFKTNPQVREAVAWILHHSYPAVPLQELDERTGSANLTEAEAIAATQAAIWFYTDDFVSDGVLTVEAAPSDTASLRARSADNVQNVFEYLTGEHNTGLTEEEVQTSVTLSTASGAEGNIPDILPETLDIEDGHILGPVAINSSSGQVDLRLEPTAPVIAIEEITLFDALGQIIEVTSPVVAENLWVHIPADMPSGGVNVTAESVEYGYTGRLIIPEPAPDRRFQTIVVVDQTAVTASTELALHWEKSEALEPPVDELPDDEAPIGETHTAEALDSAESSRQALIVKDSPKDEQSAIHAAPLTAPNEQEPTEQPQPLPVETEATAEMIPTDQSSAEELAETGAYQTRNVLVGVATLLAGGILLFVTRWRRRDLT